MKQKNIKFLENSFLFDFDKRLSSLRVSKINHPYLDVLFEYLADLDKKYVLLLIIYVFSFWRLANIEKILALIFLLILTDQTCSLLFKKQFGRMRPIKWYTHKVIDLKEQHLEYDVFIKYKDQISWTSHASMCSSHAANFFGQALLINFFFPYLGQFLFLPFFLVGIGRWYIGAHWFSDIVVGWLVGFLSYITILFLFNF